MLTKMHLVVSVENGFSGIEIVASAGDLVWTCHVRGNGKQWPQAQAEKFVRENPDKFVTTLKDQEPLSRLLPVL